MKLERYIIQSFEQDDIVISVDFFLQRSPEQKAFFPQGKAKTFFKFATTV